MNLIMNLVGASGYNADGSVRAGAAGWRAVAEALNATRSAAAGGGASGGASVGGGESAPATAGGPDSATGLTKAQSVQAADRKSGTEAGRAAPAFAEDGAGRSEIGSGSRQADGARDLFYERLVESFTAAPGASDEGSRAASDANANAGPATDGEVIAGLSLARFGFKLFGAATS